MSYYKAALQLPQVELEQFVTRLFTLAGLTPTGRATIAALALNRLGVINLRRSLLREGLPQPAHRSSPQ